MTTQQYMLVDASLNELVQERAQAYGFVTEYRVLGEDLSALVITADSADPNLSLLLLEYGNDLAVI